MKKVIGLVFGLATIVVSSYILDKRREKEHKIKTTDNEKKLKKAIKEITAKHRLTTTEFLETSNGICFDSSPMIVGFEGVYFDEETKTILGYHSTGFGTAYKFISYSREHQVACCYAYAKFSNYHH